MLTLADTNILLRLLDPGGSQYGLVRAALDTLVGRGDQICFAPQNMVEFWNVCTRSAANNGFGLSSAETEARAKMIESECLFLPDTARVHTEWRRLVMEYSVVGTQVHDARIVAAMLAHEITHLLTLNNKDFMRYDFITVVHPSDLAAESRRR